MSYSEGHWKRIAVERIKPHDFIGLTISFFEDTFFKQNYSGHVLIWSRIPSLRLPGFSPTKSPISNPKILCIFVSL